MSKKTIAGLFAYAGQEGAETMVITGKKDRLVFDYHFSSNSSKVLSLPKKYEDSLIRHLRQSLGLKDDEIANGKPGRFSYKDKDFRFKITTIPGRKENKIILELGQKSGEKWRLNELGFKSEDRKAIKKALSNKSGLILIAGDENSGKSAVLSALFAEAISDNKSACLLYNQEATEIPGASRIKISARALSSLSRHNADIIAIDEINSPSLLIEAFRNAGCGHLVIGTLRASNAAEVSKIIKSLPYPDKDKKRVLKMIVLGKIEKIKSKIGGRKSIGRFKILSF